MKKAAFISGALFGSLLGFGLMFKTMHWPGANILLVMSIALFALVFVPSFAVFRYRKTAE